MRTEKDIKQTCEMCLNEATKLATPIMKNNLLRTGSKIVDKQQMYEHILTVLQWVLGNDDLSFKMFCKFRLEQIKESKKKYLAKKIEEYKL